MQRHHIAIPLVILLAAPALSIAQTVTHVSNDAQLRTALGSAANGDSIVLDNSITITGGHLPSVGLQYTLEYQFHRADGQTDQQLHFRVRFK